MEPYFICCLILLTSFVEVHSEKKVVHRGESVLLFANVTADSPDNEVHLYINGVKNYTLIATWIFKNERFTKVQNSYFNILMDAARNIWIHNVDETYNGKYSIYKSSRPAIELIILDNSQIKSENPSQDFVLWIVIVGLAIAVSAFILYVVCKRCRNKNPARLNCMKMKSKRNQPSEGSESEKLTLLQKAEELKERMDKCENDIKQLTEKVSSEKPQYAEDLKEALSPFRARLDNHDVMMQGLEAKVSSVKPQYAEELKEALRPLRARLDNHDLMIQQLAEKAKSQNHWAEHESLLGALMTIQNNPRVSIDRSGTTKNAGNRELGTTQHDSVGENDKDSEMMQSNLKNLNPKDYF